MAREAPSRPAHQPGPSALGRPGRISQEQPCPPGSGTDLAGGWGGPVPS